MYKRPPGSQRFDHEQSKAFENEVGNHLPPYAINKTDSTTELDFEVPGFYVEVKEKRQPFKLKNWALDFEGTDIREEDLFILDELSLRKAMKHYPNAYFVLRDVPQDRMFVASVVELAVAERIRRNRQTSETTRKGKVFFILDGFRQINDLSELVPLITADLLAQPWKHSHCLGESDVVTL